MRSYSGDSLMLPCILAATKSYLTVLNNWKVQLSLRNVPKFNYFQNYYYLVPHTTVLCR